MQSPFPKKVYAKNAQIYKIMANEKRLEILNILKIAHYPVQKLADIIGISKANISQHLAILRSYGLVRTERKGKQILYFISDPRIVETCSVLKELFTN